tara:strand:- start:4984 stop:5346 length:363 start_codon:yes stop_codon:yes gene_type:complete
MSEIDYSSNYDFNLDPFIENKEADNTNKGINNNMDNNNEEAPVEVVENKEELKKPVKKQNSGCRLLLIVIIYLIVIETKLTFLVDTLLKKVLFIVLLWAFGYDLINKLIGFENNVCKYLF